MAQIRWKSYPSGRYAYLIDRGAGVHEPLGRIKEKTATRILGAYENKKALQAYGLEISVACLWTLEELHQADMEAARDRGLRTARPQRGPKSSPARESDWNQILAFFGPETNLDEISETRLRDYQAARKAEGHRVACNRQLFGVLKPALRLAREMEASGYTADPFRRIKKLDERVGRREPIALPEDDLRAVVGLCRAFREDLGAEVELLYETASRLSQQPEISNGLLYYAPQKGGKPRAFVASARTRLFDRELGKLAREPRAFWRAWWVKALQGSKYASLHPHDLRHSRLTIEAQQPGASIEKLMKLGGWKDPQMAATYLHPGGEPIRIGGSRGDRRKRVPRRTIR